MALKIRLRGLIALLSVVFFSSSAIATAVIEDDDDQMQLRQDEDKSIFDVLFGEDGNSPSAPHLGDGLINNFTTTSAKVSEESYSEGKTAHLRIVDRTLGKTHKLDVTVGAKASFNNFTINIKQCLGTKYKTLLPEGKALMEVTEVHNRISTKLFNGWIYAQSPSSNLFIHPKYDIQLESCKGV